jgi:hypothetical protein
MIKKIIIVVVVIALIFAIPDVRSRVSTRAVPLLERLGPIGAMLLTPARRSATHHEVVEIARLISADQQEGRPLPGDNENFTEWLQRRIVREDGKDVWGNPFWIRMTGVTVRVGSDGPDGKRGTGDDVTHTSKF